VRSCKTAFASQRSYKITLLVGAGLCTANNGVTLITLFIRAPQVRSDC